MEEIIEMPTFKSSFCTELNKTQRFKNTDCSVVQNSINPILIDFYFCSCDINQQDPICSACAHNCHRGHTLSQVYRGEQICKCAQNNHKIDYLNELKNFYEPTCYFNEVLNIIGKLSYYQDEKNEELKVCLLCKQYCNHEDEFEQPVKFKKITIKVEEELPECLCTLDTHNDIKVVYKQLNFFQKDMLKYDNIYPIQLLNAVFESEDFFKNVYGNFEKMFTKLQEESEKDFLKSNDETIKYSNVFRSLKNLTRMCESIKTVFYFSIKSKNFFLPAVVASIIKSKTDNYNKYCLKFKYYVMKCFEIITIDEEFQKLPSIKIPDFEYFSPFQRIIIVSSVRFSNDFQKKFLSQINIVNVYLEGFEKMLKLSFSYKVEYHLLNTYLRTIKKFAKFYLLEYSQVIKFCTIVQIIFSKSNAFKTKDKTQKFRDLQLKTLTNMIKILYLFSIYHNDKNIVYHICSERKEQLSVFHSQNNVGSIIYISIINILNFIRNDLNSHLENQTIKKILVISTKIISLSLMDNDFYLTGLKRNINENFSKYLDIIKFNYTLFEKNVVLNMSKVSAGLEISYNDSVIRNNIKSISVKNVIIEFFGYIQREDLIKHQVRSHLEGVKKQSIFKFHQSGGNFVTKRKEIEESLAKYKDKEDIFQKKNNDDQLIRILMMHTNFLSNVMKSIDIFSHFEKQLNKEIDYILKLLYFFMYDNCDNSIYCLSSMVFDRLLKVGVAHVSKIFDFVLTCLHVISSSNYEICFSQIIIKKISDYVFSSQELLTDKNAIFMLLKIYSSILFETNCLNLSDSIELTRKYLIMLYRQSEVVKEYKKSLLELIDKDDSNSESELANGKNKIDDDSDKSEIPLGTTMRSTVKSGNISFSIFLQFLKLVNHAFDEKSNTEEKKFFKEILDHEEIKSILATNYMIDIGIRSEILKFFRIAKVEVFVLTNKTDEYMSSFFDHEELESKGMMLNESNRFKNLDFLQRLMKVSEGEITNNEFEVLFNELNNFKEIFYYQVSFQPREKLKDYIEFSLFVVLRSFLNKFLSFIGKMESSECINIYLLTINIIKIKLFILDNHDKIYLEGQENYMEGSINAERLKLETELKTILEVDFPVLDYNKISIILNKVFLKDQQRGPSHNECFLASFETVDERIDVLKSNYEEKGLLKSTDQLIMFEIVQEYLRTKENFESNNIISNLSQYLIDDNVTYRFLLLKYLFFASQSNVLLSNMLSRNSFVIILKILQFDTTRAQHEIIKLYKINETSIINFEAMKDMFITLFVELTFSSFNPSINQFSENYAFACNLIKIFKFLCEEHNNDFQQIFLNKLTYKLKTEHGIVKASFFEFFLLVVEKIVVLSGWDNHTKHNKTVSDYFYEMFSLIIEMLIEIVQGTKEEYLLHLMGNNTGKDKVDKKSNKFLSNINEETKKVFPNFIKFIKKVIITDNWNKKLMFNVKKGLADLVLTFLEEKNVPAIIKKFISNLFHPKVMSECICLAFKKYYFDLITTKTAVSKSFKKFNKHFQFQNKSKRSTILNKSYREMITFDKTLVTYFKEMYYKDLTFNQTPEFNYSNTLFHIIKILELYQQTGESQQFFSNVREINKLEGTSFSSLFADKADQSTKHDILFLEICNVINFFESITAMISIQLEDGVILNTIYTKNPRIPFLSKNTREAFIEGVNRDNRNSKLLDLIDNCHVFKEEILYNYKKSTESRFFQYFNEIDYKILLNRMFAITLLENILMLLNYDIYSYPDHIEKSLFIISITEICVYSTILFFWLNTKLPLFLMLEQKNTERATENEVENTWIGNTWLVFRTLKKKHEVISIIWNISFALLSIAFPSIQIIYAFKMLIMLELNDTLKNIRYAVEYRAKPLTATFSFMVILCYVFAIYAFYMFNEDFFDFDVFY